MPLEPTVTNIADLNPAWPAPADSKSDGDDHIRNLKKAMLNDFAGFTGAVMVTGTDGGAANAYTLTPANALPAYSLRMAAVFSPTVTNTGAATLTISGLAAAPIVSVAGAALVSGDLVAGRIYLAVYDGASFRLAAITKNYVDQLAFSSALPGQASNAGKFLSTDGTTASWQQVYPAQAGKTGYFLTTDGAAASWGNALKTSVVRFADGTDATKLAAFDLSGLTTASMRTYALPDASGTLALRTDTAMQLLAQATVAVAVANIDFLTIFSAAYDRYIVEVEGLQMSVADIPVMTLAKAGASDTSTSYSTMATDGGGGGLIGSYLKYFTGTHLQATLTYDIRNVNSAGVVKAVGVRGILYQSTPAWTSILKEGAYGAANTVTGFRLSCQNGSNFTAGTIRIYGVKNS